MLGHRRVCLISIGLRQGIAAGGARDSVDTNEMIPNEDYLNSLAERVHQHQRIADLEALVASLYRRAQAAESTLLRGQSWHQYHQAEAEYSWQHPEFDADAHNRRARLLLELTRKEDK